MPVSEGGRLLRPLQDAELLASLLLDPSCPPPLWPVGARLLRRMPWPRAVSHRLLQAAWVCGFGPRMDAHALSHGVSQLALARSSQDPALLSGLAAGLSSRSDPRLPSLLLCNRSLPDEEVRPLVRLLLGSGLRLPSEPPDLSLLFARLQDHAGGLLTLAAAEVGWAGEPPLSLLFSPRLRLELPDLFGLSPADLPQALAAAGPGLRRDLTPSSLERCRAGWARLRSSAPAPQAGVVADAPPTSPASSARSVAAVPPNLPLPPSDGRMLEEASRLSAAHVRTLLLERFALRLLQDPPGLVDVLSQHVRVSDRLLSALVRSAARSGCRQPDPSLLLSRMGPEGLASLLLRLRSLRLRWTAEDVAAGLPGRQRLLREGGSDLFWLLGASEPPSVKAASCALLMGSGPLRELPHSRRLQVLTVAFGGDVGLLLLLPQLSQLLLVEEPGLLLRLPRRLASLDSSQVTAFCRLLRFRFPPGRLPDASSCVLLLDRLLGAGSSSPAGRWLLRFAAVNRGRLGQVTDADLDRLLALHGRLDGLSQPLGDVFCLLLDVLETGPLEDCGLLLGRLEGLAERLLVLQGRPQPRSQALLELVLRLSDGWEGSPEDLLEVSLLVFA